MKNKTREVWKEAERKFRVLGVLGEIKTLVFVMNYDVTLPTQINSEPLLNELYPS